MPVRSVVLDGEGVICGPDGKSDFDRMRMLQPSRRALRDAPRVAGAHPPGREYLRASAIIIAPCRRRTET